MALSFTYRLRKRAQQSVSAVARRESAALRSEVLRLRATRPQPMRSYDVGAANGELIYRSELGIVATAHPIASTAGYAGMALRANGCVAHPLLPPHAGGIRICPDSSGALCYFDEHSGSASWDAPSGSLPLVQSPLASMIALTSGESPPFSEPPPRLPPGLGFGALRGTSWIPMYEDSAHRILLFHAETGCVRVAPWISLRTSYGYVFFANLVTRQTRWLPPHGWMQGWISRPPFDEEGRIHSTPFDGTRLARDLLPGPVARLRVEGGAPYLWELGQPIYGADEGDTPSTYPLGHLLNTHA